MPASAASLQTNVLACFAGLFGAVAFVWITRQDRWRRGTARSGRYKSFESFRLFILKGMGLNSPRDGMRLGLFWVVLAGWWRGWGWECSLQRRAGLSGLKM